MEDKILEKVLDMKNEISILELLDAIVRQHNEIARKRIEQKVAKKV